MKSRGFQKLILTFALPPFFCQERVRAGAIVRLCKRRQFSALFPFVYPSTAPFTVNGIVPLAVLQNTVTVFLKYLFHPGTCLHLLPTYPHEQRKEQEQCNKRDYQPPGCAGSQREPESLFIFPHHERNKTQHGGYEGKEYGPYLHVPRFQIRFQGCYSLVSSSSVVVFVQHVDIRVHR